MLIMHKLPGFFIMGSEERGSEGKQCVQILDLDQNIFRASFKVKRYTRVA